MWLVLIKGKIFDKIKIKFKIKILVAWSVFDGWLDKKQLCSDHLWENFMIAAFGHTYFIIHF